VTQIASPKSLGTRRQGGNSAAVLSRQAKRADYQDIGLTDVNLSLTPVIFLSLAASAARIHRVLYYLRHGRVVLPQIARCSTRDGVAGRPRMRSVASDVSVS